MKTLLKTQLLVLSILISTTTFSQISIIKLTTIFNYSYINSNKQIDDNIYGFDVTDFFDDNPALNDPIYFYSKELRPKIIRYQAPS
jgi:hypothetical protein